MRLVALSDIADMLGGVSRTRATEITNRSTFPDPIDTVASGKVRVWDRADVEAWIRRYRPNQPRGGDDEQP
ncbi:helix-turn-helix transcriptional regulator [Micromonospora schwarzwaldensis]|uniref:helix-turn-helix transcriptional regulator n=1 Tax=Micromonospora sp. DSM 45708 TaxID=3111767 RepID=UPI0031CE24B3